MSIPTQLDRYLIKEKLAEGLHRSLYLGVDPQDNRKYAIKHALRTVVESKRFLEQVKNEYECARRIDHPGVRRAFRLVIKRSLTGAKEVVSALEYLEGRTLDTCKPESIPHLIRIFCGVAEALHAIHREGLIHTDVKPRHIMVLKHHKVKLLDLTHACPEHTVKNHIEGTPNYIAPEQVRRDELTRATDVFNLGATMYRCFTGHFISTMLRGKNDLARNVAVKNIPPHHLNAHIPTALSNLILDSIAPHPDDRPRSMVEVHAKLVVMFRNMKRPKRTTTARSAATSQAAAS